jgi:hypothetical protein
MERRCGMKMQNKREERRKEMKRDENAVRETNGT